LEKTDRMILMFKLRIISGIIGVAVLLAVIYAGGVYWKTFFVFLGIIGLYEYYGMMRNRSFKVLVIPGFLLLFLLLFSPFISGYLFVFSWIIALLIVINLVIKYPGVTVNDLSLSMLGAVYIGFLLSYAVRMADVSNAFMVMFLALILTWSSDIGGYAFGVTWGKNKLTPDLSPNKTWEGSIGGIFLSAIASGVFFELWGIAGVNCAYAILLGVVSSIMGQLGDLFMSAIKRYFGVKDSGNIIPGHGGVLDRFDSFMLVVPLVYYFFSWLVG